MTPALASLPHRCVATSRLRLRTPTSDDLPSLLPILRDPPTVEYTWFVSPRGENRWTDATLLQHFEWQAAEELAGRRADWVIHLHDHTETVIGRCALFRPAGTGDWELGITISSAFQGHGYGEEATRALLDFAFTSLSARDVVLEVLPDNERMQCLCRRLGLVPQTSAMSAPPSGPLQLKYDHYVVDADLWRSICASSG